jgi:hypothetical protein
VFARWTPKYYFKISKHYSSFSQRIAIEQVTRKVLNLPSLVSTRIFTNLHLTTITRYSSIVARLSELHRWTSHRPRKFRVRNQKIKFQFRGFYAFEKNKERSQSELRKQTQKISFWRAKTFVRSSWIIRGNKLKINSLTELDWYVDQGKKSWLLEPNWFPDLCITLASLGLAHFLRFQ